MSRIVCFYHHDCLDGFAAMLAVKKFAGLQDAEFVAEPVIYGNDVPIAIEPSDFVYIVDFSYPVEIVREISTQAAAVDIYDHHSGAASHYEDVTAEHGRGNLLNVKYIFDCDESGAGIAWRHLHGTIPQWVLHVSDRDRWKFEFVQTKNVCAMLMTFGLEYSQNWADVLSDDFNIETLYAPGAAINLARDQMIKHVAEYTNDYFKLDQLGLVAYIECPRIFTSEALEYVIENNMLGENGIGFMGVRTTVAVGWHVDGQRYKYSLRSCKGGPDISYVAKLYGGGGHSAAASFYLPIDGKSAKRALYDAQVRMLKLKNPSLLRRLGRLIGVCE